MYYCRDCNTEFERPKEVKDKHSELNGMGGVTYETFCVCPNCGSDWIEEMEKCEMCGEWSVDLELFGRTDICDECRKKIEAKLIDLRDYIQAEGDIDDYKEAEDIALEVAEALWN